MQRIEELDLDSMGIKALENLHYKCKLDRKKARDNMLIVHGVMEGKRVTQAMKDKVDAMSSTERRALMQVISNKGIESTENVNAI